MLENIIGARHDYMEWDICNVNCDVMDEYKCYHKRQ